MSAASLTAKWMSPQYPHRAGQKPGGGGAGFYARRPMLGTYAAFAVILLGSACVGQGILCLCGRRDWSWLAPAVGLAAITAVAWGTVRLPGEGTAAAIAIGVLVVVALGIVWGRVPGARTALAGGIPALVAALVLGSLPFVVERRFGILGTGLNPDMSQHLLTAERLAHGAGARLVTQGYPLGPHSLAVAASKATGASIVHAFDGLTLAIAASAVLAPLELLGRLNAWRRTLGAVLVGLPYLVASYLIQGAFKETMEALLVLAFAIGLHQVAAGTLAPAGRRWLAAVPLAVLAIGSVYSYSFPGLLWLAGAAGIWALVELAVQWRGRSASAAASAARAAALPVAVALGLLVVAAAPEIGRMVNFASFETFNPPGPGLGNLFNPISPLEALGIWPSGDFRLDPGDGAMPAVGYYLGELLGLAALAYGLAWWLRRREWAVPSALAAAVALYTYAHFGGTAYQAAKATVIASPLAMMIAVRALLSPEDIVELGTIRGAVGRTRTGATGLLLRWQGKLGALLAVAFCGVAAACTVLALVNGPVGPATYSPALTQLRPELEHGSTLVLVSGTFLADEHGRDYVVWELRGGRVCVDAERPRNNVAPGNGYRPRAPAGIAHVVTGEQGTAPFAGFRLERRAGPYILWARHPAPAGEGPCPLIAAGGRANPAGD
jgi:hypothetical protein